MLSFDFRVNQLSGFYIIECLGRNGLIEENIHERKRKAAQDGLQDSGFYQEEVAKIN